MLRAFCRRRRLPFHFAPLVPPRLVRSRRGLPKRFARALVGFSLLRRLRPRGDKLRSHRRCAARLQLSHCARSLRNQSGDENQSPPAHWVGDRADWRNRCIISFLLVGFVFLCVDRLHVWCVANSHLTFRVMTASSSTFRLIAEFIISGRGASQFGQRRGFYGT